MTDQQRRFARFVSLHRPGEPLILFNAWDAGSARAVAQAGAPAIATGSWSVAAAHGFGDGEALPLELAIANAARIVAAVPVPVTIDLESGYAVDPDQTARNLALLAATGAVGCNLEDQVIGGSGLHPIGLQVDRIGAARDLLGFGFFINARTDVFLKLPRDRHADGLGEALERAHAYGEAGASGFFVPGLIDRDLIGRVCEAVRMPVNVMAVPDCPNARVLGSVGVARISYGPGPYRAAMARLCDAAAEHYR
jgi:2-methylisocitrate lyase-like PEP mutase family enzyme